jgi:hypothetical protein
MVMLLGISQPKFLFEIYKLCSRKQHDLYNLLKRIAQPKNNYEDCTL